MISFAVRCAALILLPLVLVACAGDAVVPAPAGTSQSASQAESVAANQRFDQFVETFIQAALDRSPEWAIYQGHYEQAGQMTIPDAAWRQAELDYMDGLLAQLAAIDRDRLSADRGTDHDLLSNRFRSSRFYIDELRAWAWQPSQYNVAGPLSLLLNTEFAPLEERLELVSQRLAQVPAYYRAARLNLDHPSLEHTELALGQSLGTLGVLEDIRARADEAGLADDLDGLLDDARAAVTHWMSELESLQEELVRTGTARSFRLGGALYEKKFRHDIQAGFGAEELYRRALAEKERLLQAMDGHARSLWSQYFSGQPLPADRLERIGRMIDRLSDDHGTVEEFVENIRRQIPELEAFVREVDLLDQDPDKPLIVRETPEYMRGTGAIASVSAPGPFNPGANTYYNVTPLESYGEELAASYLREYNNWMVQILNIHEAIPGHYTQLVHANKSPSLVKSLFGNGAMIEGWAVYSERAMLEAGWGNHAPELQLMHGKWLLRVVHNTILDYAVHVLGMEQDEALRLMRQEAFQEESEATQKWRRITLTQVQLTSYYAGYAAIVDLRQQLANVQGDAFNIKDFHNEFLSYGSAPVASIARMMLMRH